MDALHNNHAIINGQQGDGLCPVSSFEHYLKNLQPSIIEFFQKTKQVLYRIQQNVVRQESFGWHDENYQWQSKTF